MPSRKWRTARNHPLSPSDDPTPNSLSGPLLRGPDLLSETEQKMTRAPILFRVDGTRRHGWESLWRCLTYAAALQRRRRPTHFLAQLDPPELAQQIKRVGNEWIEATSSAGTVDDI